MTAPLLFLGWGNPSRGDDALAPLLCDRLAAYCADNARCEVLLEFQLQVENALDLQGREAVVFLDASASARPPFEFGPLFPQADRNPLTHAMLPQALLATATAVLGSTPPAFLMAIRGEAFELGAGLTNSAAAHLAEAWRALREIAEARDALVACRALAQRYTSTGVEL